MRTASIRGIVERTEQARAVALLDRLAHPRREGLDIGRVCAVTGAELVQVMRQAARTDDQHAFVGQRCQRLPEGPGALRIQSRWQRHLKHRHVGLRVQVHQRHPGAMVEAALRVGLCRPARLRELLDRAPGQRLVAAHRILDPVQGGVEAAEVVNRLRLSARAHAWRARHPVRRDHEHGVRPRQLPAQRRQPWAGQTGFERKGRRAVRDEQAGEAGHQRSAVSARSIDRRPAPLNSSESDAANRASAYS